MAILSLPPIAYQKPPKNKKVASKAKVKGTRQCIFDYLRDHPESQRDDIAKALGITSSAVAFHLQELKKAGDVLAVRKDSKWLWSVKNLPLPDIKPEVFDDERPEPIVNHKDGLDKPGRHICSICGKVFSFPGGLTVHMRMNHLGGK
jgi:biotin operon repressor